MPTDLITVTCDDCGLPYACCARYYDEGGYHQCPHCQMRQEQPAAAQQEQPQ